MGSTESVGRRLGGYTIERELGSGGMGLVILARQTSLDRLAVLKRIHPELVADAELEERFEREAVAAARLHHPNVVCVYERFSNRGRSYLATEFVDGVDLAAVLASESKLPWRIAATIALEIARGLEAIHGQGTLHRDLKPQNLLIGRHGEVKITDFGLALDASAGPLTRPGVALGTPPYMPPEQMRGERVDLRADLFSFGAVLYEMLAGETPYQMPLDEEDDSILERLESGRYPRLRASCRDAPRMLVRTIRDCLRPLVQKRIASVTKIRQRLEEMLDRPTPAECMHSIARFAWERRIFESRSTETVVVVAAAPTVPRRRVRSGFAVAVLVASIGFLAWSFASPTDLLRLTDGLLAGFQQT